MAVLVISYRGVNSLYFLFQKVADTRNSIQWRAIERKTVGGNLKISANRTVNNIVCYLEVTNRVRGRVYDGVVSFIELVIVGI